MRGCGAGVRFWGAVRGSVLQHCLASDQSDKDGLARICQEFYASTLIWSSRLLVQPGPRGEEPRRRVTCGGLGSSWRCALPCLYAAIFAISD